MTAVRIEIQRLPQSVDEFVALRDEHAPTPEGAAATMVVALLLYGEDQDLGKPCLAKAVDPSRTRMGASGDLELQPRALNLIRMQLGQRPYIPRSYLEGATPENAYTLPEEGLAVRLTRNPYSGSNESGRVKLFIASSGADSPRPMTVVRDSDGVWRATEWSSLLSGVRPPADAPDRN